MQCEGSWDTLAKAWISQVMLPRTMAIDTPSQRAYLVLHSTNYGCIAWSAPLRTWQARRDGAGYSLDGGRCAEGDLQLLILENLQNWLAYELTLESPATAGQALQLRLSGARTPLYQYAAKRGFAGTPLSCLRKLLVLRGLEAVSSNQVDVKRALISDALPELSAEEIQKLEEQPQISCAAPCYDSHCGC